MKASELRIGNYVTEKGRLILIHDGFGIDHAHNFEPIEITEELLLKFGFEKLYEEYFSIFGDIDCVPMEYIHQIQNLYFALTGEELILKK